MITGRDFIITSLQSWDIAIGSNAKDIAREIAKTTGYSMSILLSIP